MSKRRALALAAAAALLTAMLCLLLQRFDNKYSATDAQPVNGLLALTEQELAVSPVRSLINQWIFYPGELISPGEDTDAYRIYADIGDNAPLTDGLGTYALTIMLPNEPRAYALELPEIYSACRLYINGGEALAMGDLAGSATQMGSRVVPFTASGRVGLLLQVRDGGSIYSGMTYPPSFGEQQSVIARREARLLLHGGAALLGLLMAALAATFGLRGGRRRGLLALLGALCFSVTCGVGVLRAIYTLTLQPLLTIDMACRYGLLLLMLLIVCDMYELWNRRGALICAPCAVGLIAAVLRTAFSPMLGAGAAAAFSVMCAFLKYYMAAALIGLSVFSLSREDRHTVPLLCASVSLAVFLCFDRIFPLYEPIYGGWLPEVGFTVVVAALTGMLWLDATNAYRFHLTYAGVHEEMEREIELQKEHYRQLSDQIERARQSAHDLRHHVRTIRSLADQGLTSELIGYLDEYEPHLSQSEVTTFSDHITADAVLCHYAAEAKRIGAVYDVRFAVPSDLDFPDDELCILLGNLIENAIEAMARQTSGPRRLYLRGDAQGGRLGIAMDNTFSGEICTRDGQYISAKRSGPGIGLRSVQAIAEKHGGLVDFSAENGIFHSSVLVPLPASAAIK